MKKFVSLGLVAVAILAFSLSYGRTAFAQTWEVFVSNHRFVINGESVEAGALNINGRNYISVADFAELLGLDVYFDNTTTTVYLDNNNLYAYRNACFRTRRK